MKKRLLWILLSAFIGLLIGLFKNYENNFETVAVNLSGSFTVSLYKYNKGHGSTGYKPDSKPIYTLASSKKVRLADGTYVFVVNNSNQEYQNPITVASISRQTNIVNVTPFYSMAVLNSMLNREQNTIRASLLNAYPSLNTYYTISKEQLYDQGEWYGASLNAISPNNDNLKVILRHTNGVWAIAATPQISIGSPSNPLIPISIIESVDGL